jgi:hypothetical protein
VLLKAIARAAEKLGTQERERHGIPLTMYIGTTPLNTKELWPKLEAAMDLIAEHSPIWLERMRKMNNTVNVRRIPGNRARLIQERLTILDPYLLANFPPAQIASSIVHEGTHAMMRYHKFKFDPSAPAREERACRRSELRLGKVLAAAGVAGANAVVERAQGALAMPDNQVGVVIDWKAMKVLEVVTTINELPVPLWLKRLIARRRGVLHTPQGIATFGK